MAGGAQTFAIAPNPLFSRPEMLPANHNGNALML